MKNAKTVCIVGVGNSLRTDDGIGHYVCRCIESKNLPGVETLLVQQLHLEMTEKFLMYDRVIIVDASVKEIDVEIFRVDEQIAAATSSHHANAVALQHLAALLYYRKLPLYVCAVKGETFDFGEKISMAGKKRADQAVDKILALINEKSLTEAG